MANDWKFEDYSEKVKRFLGIVTEGAMESACLLVEGQAKALAPVGSTSELRDKITHQVIKKDGNIIGQVGSPLMYAIYVEFGTGEFSENGAGRKGGWVYQDPSGQWFFTWGMEPQPFLRPAFRRNKKNIENILGQKLKTSFKKNGGK